MQVISAEVCFLVFMEANPLFPTSDMCFQVDLLISNQSAEIFTIT